jgi:nucleoside-diphosphate-sugar epimerase
VADIVQANLKAMKCINNDPFQILNIGTAQQSSVLELLTCLETIIGGSFQTEYRPERRGELRHSLSDIQKAQKLLGFQPNVSLYKGLQELVNYTKARSQDQLNTLQIGEPVETVKKACNA